MSTSSNPDVGVRLPHPGHIFEKKYRIEKLLGSGGFARVYLANFEDLNRRVAIKILVPTEPAPTYYPSRLNARFLREAQLISELRNPATVTMHDFGRSEEGLLYMVFEFVDGKTVEELLREQGAMSEARTLRVVEQVLRGLDEAHVHGILHRDIKPANIMVYDYLDDRDLVKLLDFGIAKPILRDDDGPDLTRDNTLLGTPRYMSPEQIVNEDLTPASDIYSLGLVAFEMIMGEPALSDTDRSTIIRTHLDSRNFTLPNNLAITPGFRFILQKMVAKQISVRFNSAKEAISAIEAWRNGTLQIEENTGRDASWSEAPTENPDANPQTFPGTQHQTHGANAPGTSNAHVASGSGFGGHPPAGFGGTAPGGFGGSPQAANPVANQPANQPANPTSGFGSAPPQNFGTGTSTSTPQHVNHGGGAIARPAKTKVMVENTGTRLTVTVPPIPSPRDMVFVGGALLLFVVMLMFFNFAFLVAAGVGVAFFVARLLAESSLVLDTHTGYEVTQTVLGLDRSSRGPMSAVLRLTHTVDDDDVASLTLATHDGDRKLARNLTVEEALWVEQQVNGFLEASRGQTA